MTEPWLGVVNKLTEFFAPAQIEACARRTGFVRRTSKLTGKVFLSLVTVGAWSMRTPSLGQLVAKAAQVPTPVDISPEALHQRMTRPAVVFLRALLQRAFTQLHKGDTICDTELFSPFPAVHIADSTGVELPPSLKDLFPGSGGGASVAGAKMQLVWEYLSQSFAHLALVAGTTPDNTYIDTVVKLAQRGALFLFDLGYFKVKALAQIAAAEAYFLTRLNHQTALSAAVAGRLRRVELPGLLHGEARSLVEHVLYLGARERLAVRLIAARVPEAVVNERRRQARRVAKKRGYTPSQAHLTLLAWNLFVTNVPTTVWTPATVCTAYSLRWQIAVSREGSITQSVQVRPRLRDSGLVAREAPGRESKPVKPSDNTLCKESAQRSRLQRTVNADVASSHATPVAETVDNGRRQQGPRERSLSRRFSPAGSQRRHGAKGDRATGEVRGARRRKLVGEA
jgi:hypothetical protein